MRACTLFILLLLSVISVASARIGAFPEKGLAFSLSPTRYNRVEGLFLGAEVVIAPLQWRGAGLFGSGGYGRANRAWRYEAGLQVRRGGSNLSASYFNRTVSLDDSLITTSANSFLALTSKRDYKDYFQARDGVEVAVSHRHKKIYVFSARVALSTLRNMPRVTNWSLFRRKAPFRDNPRIEEGKEGLISATMALDQTAPESLLRSGTYLSATYERRFRDFENDGLTLALRRYQVMPFGHQTLVLRGTLSSRTRLAAQDSLHLLYLGGIGTLRGYTFREFSGNRMLLFSADYVFRRDFFSLFPFKFSKLLDLVLFFDAGWTARRPPSASLFSGFGDVQWGDFKSNAGVAVALSRQILRLDVARRLDRRHAGWVITVQAGKNL